MNYFKSMRMKEKILALALVGMLLLPAGVQAGKYATVVNPQTGERKVVRVGESHAFDGGFALEVAYGYKPVSEKELGFSVVSSYKTNLSTSMTSTQTTVPVASMETKDGHTLTMANLGDKVFLTIEPGGSKEEIVMCTGISGDYWTGCTRGLAFYATSTVTVNENRKSHIAGSIVIMSNVHYVYEQFVDKDTAETIEGVKTFTNYPRIATYTAPILNNEFVAKKYVDDVAVAGAPNAGTTTKGIVEIVEQNELGTGTTTGETGAELVLPNRLATTTSVSGKYVVVTESDGKINQNFLDLNEDFAFGGEVSVTGTTTLATTTVSDLTIASGTIQQWPTASTSVATKGYVDYMGIKPYVKITPSDVLIKSANTERHTTNSSYTKVKEIIAPHKGTYRIKFDLRINGTAGKAYARIYKNGVAYGTEREEAGSTYVTYSEDLFFSEGDLIQLYYKTDGDPAFVRNFRIYGSFIPIATVNLD